LDTPIGPINDGDNLTVDFALSIQQSTPSLWYIGTPDEIVIPVSGWYNVSLDIQSTVDSGTLTKVGIFTVTIQNTGNASNPVNTVLLPIDLGTDQVIFNAEVSGVIHLN